MAARQLFVERGYPATTIEAIADAAATPLATVYRLFGSKRGILSAVLDVAFGGDDEPIAFADHPGVQAALAELGRLLRSSASRSSSATFRKPRMAERTR
ncbi:MAG: TetR/AcrR family transcriptional regulator [Actinomycetota bacterium]|nr:TetR/AcrR family transcriptional regulator [Actinomycetota bacterium]